MKAPKHRPGASSRHRGRFGLLCRRLDGILVSKTAFLEARMDTCSGAIEASIDDEGNRNIVPESK